MQNSWLGMKSHRISKFNGRTDIKVENGYMYRCFTAFWNTTTFIFCNICLLMSLFKLPTFPSVLFPVG